MFFPHHRILVPRHEILSIIRLILNTLTVAMRFEPGNVRLFENEVGVQGEDLVISIPTDRSL